MRLGTLTRMVVTTALLIFGWLFSTLAVYPYLTPGVRAASEDVEVWVEGPWAYADDPRPGQTGIVLIAPNATSINHLPPAVGYADGDSPVGVSTITINKLTTPSPCPARCVPLFPPPVPVDKNKLISLLNTSAGNYVISLPHPDYYEQAVGQESRLRYGWWDECRPFNAPHVPPNKNCQNTSVQKKFVTKMILHYSVTTLDGFFLDATRHEFEDQRFIHIFMTPQGKMDPCDTGGRRAFAGLVGLFTLKSAEPLYIDLPSPVGPYASDDPPGAPNCLDNDPQKPVPPPIAGSLEDALSYLDAYIVNPEQGEPRLARACFERVYNFRYLLPKDPRHSFEENMETLDKFLKRVQEGSKPSSKEQIKALQTFEVAKKSINRHDGSGACRNPLLPLSPI
jgi:hypothetical protein